MARNFVQPGDVITLTAPVAVKSGGVVHVGALIGVAAYDAPEGAEVETALTGVYELPKGAEALPQGGLAFWDGEKVVGEGDLMLGAVVAASHADTTTVRVRLNGVTS